MHDGGTGGSSLGVSILRWIGVLVIGCCAIAWYGPVDALDSPPSVSPPRARSDVGSPPPTSADATRQPPGGAPAVAGDLRPVVGPEASDQHASDAVAADTAAGPTAVGQQLIVVVPPHELASAPGAIVPADRTPGLLPRTGSSALTLRLALVAIGLIAAGVLLGTARRRRPRVAPSGVRLGMPFRA